MSNVAAVAHDADDAAAQDGGTSPAEAAPSDATAAEAWSQPAPWGWVAQPPVGARRRALLVPVLSTVVAALIAAMFGFAVVGFNTLRDDIRALDAKFDARIDDLDAKLEARFAAQDTKFEARFAAQDTKFEARFAAQDTKIESLDAKIEALDAKFDARFAAQDAKFDALEARFDAKIDMLRADMNDGFAQIQSILLDHTERLARLEAIHGIHVHQP